MNEELITDNEIKTAQYHRGQYELRNNIYPEMLKDGETAPSRDDLNQYGVRVVYFTDGNRKSFVTSNINHDNAIIHINKNLSESEKNSLMVKEFEFIVIHWGWNIKNGLKSDSLDVLYDG